MFLASPQIAAANGEVIVAVCDALPDDGGDDAAAFVRAMNSPYQTVVVPKGWYVLRELASPIPVSAHKKVQCELGAVFLVPVDAVMALPVKRNGYEISLIFAALSRGRHANGFSMTDCGFVIEKSNVVPIQIERKGSRGIVLFGLSIDRKGSANTN